MNDQLKSSKEWAKKVDTWVWVWYYN